MLEGQHIRLETSKKFLGQKGRRLKNNENNSSTHSRGMEEERGYAKTHFQVREQRSGLSDMYFTSN